jgi:hypothetical protein
MSIRANNKDNAFAMNIINNRQQYRKMEDIMDIIDCREKRGKITNITENFYI